MKCRFTKGKNWAFGRVRQVHKIRIKATITVYKGNSHSVNELSMLNINIALMKGSVSANACTFTSIYLKYNLNCVDSLFSLKSCQWSTYLTLHFLFVWKYWFSRANKLTRLKPNVNHPGHCTKAFSPVLFSTVMVDDCVHTKPRELNEALCQLVSISRFQFS